MARNLMVAALLLTGLSCGTAGIRPASPLDYLRHLATADDRLQTLQRHPLASPIPNDAARRARVDRVTFFTDAAGHEQAVFFRRWTIRPGICGNGFIDGAVRFPIELKCDRTLFDVIAVDAAGRPAFRVRPWLNGLTVMDADGDGQAHELVRWSDQWDCGRPPFVAIHDLSRPELRTMLLLVFNPDAYRRRDIESRNRSSDALESSEAYPWTSLPQRSGRWRFERNGRNRNDVVLEERVGDTFVEAARFTLSPDGRCWEGPPGSADGLWTQDADPWMRCDLTFLK
jgi:hypothetical protein